MNNFDPEQQAFVNALMTQRNYAFNESALVQASASVLTQEVLELRKRVEELTPPPTSAE